MIIQSQSLKGLLHNMGADITNKLAKPMYPFMGPNQFHASYCWYGIIHKKLSIYSTKGTVVNVRFAIGEL